MGRKNQAAKVVGGENFLTEKTFPGLEELLESKGLRLVLTCANGIIERDPFGGNKTMQGYGDFLRDFPYRALFWVFLKWCLYCLLKKSGKPVEVGSLFL